MVSRFLLGLAGWLLVLAVIFAPWAYGATRPEGILVLNIICYSAASSWILGRLVSLTLPKIPWLLWVCGLIILFQGWWMTGNARSIYDAGYGDFALLAAPFPEAPGSVDQDYSRGYMTTLTALFLACLVTADLGRRRDFRRRVLAAMILAGVSLSVLGLAILLGNLKILWWPYGKSPFMFATFRYHANAGSFLNLVWPLSLASTVLAFAKERNKWLRGLSLLGSLILFLAVVVNASKGAQGVAAAVFLVAAGLFILQRKQLFPALDLKLFGAGLAALMCIFLAFAFLIGTKQAEKRWKSYWAKDSESLRSRVYHITFQMAGDSGAFGWGPATFKTKFPAYNALSEKKVPMFWRDTHQDYLQTVVEWGYFGTLVWTIFTGVGCIRLFFSIRAQWRSRHLTDSLFALAIFLCLGGVFAHALVDFPLQVASLQLYTLVFLGFAWGSPEWVERARLRSPEKPANP